MRSLCNVVAIGIALAACTDRHRLGGSYADDSQPAGARGGSAGSPLGAGTAGIGGFGGAGGASAVGGNGGSESGGAGTAGQSGSSGAAGAATSCRPQEIWGRNRNGFTAILSNGDAVHWGDTSVVYPGPFQHFEGACGLRLDGSVECFYGDTTPAEHFKAVTSGSGFACGLRDDATARCWELGVPLKLGIPRNPEGTFKQLVADSDRLCGIRTDGTVTYFSEQALPSPSGTFVDVGLGELIDCGVQTNGEAFCWEIDTGTAAFSLPDAPPGPFEKVVLSQRFPCGLRSDGSVACWGLRGIEVPEATFTHLAASRYEWCGLQIDGVISCWGILPGVPPADVGCCRAPLLDDFSTDPGAKWNVTGLGVWSEQGGTFSIGFDEIRYEGGFADLKAPLSGWRNVDIEATLKIDSGSTAGLRIRDGYYIGLYPADKKIRLIREHPSYPLELGQADANIEYGEYHTVGIAASGCSLSVSLDGVTVIEATDTLYVAGNIGLRAFEGSATWDSIDIRCFGSAVCPL